MVKYTYDAWGNHIATGSDGTVIYHSARGVIDGYENHIGNINPIRYRGYYYDTETGLYSIPPSVYGYTRYYDPEIGRFLSPAPIESLDPYSINGLNLYSLPNSNPVTFPENNTNIYSSGLSGGDGGFAAGSGGYVGSVNTSPGSVASQIDTRGLGILGKIVGGAQVVSQLIGQGFGALSSAFAAQAANLASDLIFTGGGIISKWSNRLGDAYTALANTNAARGKFFGAVSKVAKGIGIGLFVLDLGLSAYNNFSNSSLTTGQKIGFTVMDWGVSGAVFALGMWGGPIGALVGLGVWAIYEFWLKDVIRGWFS